MKRSAERLRRYDQGVTERSSHVDITELADGLYMIDAHMEGMRERLSCYLYDTPEPLLIDAGPSTSFAHLTEVLAHLGVDALATVLITHVHIDHGGAAGHFAKRFPDTRIAVHHVGAPHLARPGRLWNSTARIYGKEALREMWGEMIPVPEDRIDHLFEGDTVSIGTPSPLMILDTPGHANHHVTIFDPQSGGMYVGDAVGLCYPHGHGIQPNSPPPDFDPRLLTGQLRRMAALDPAFVGFAHFGPRHDAQAALQESEARVWEWVSLIQGLGDLGEDEAVKVLRDDTLGRYREAGASEEQIKFYDAAAGRWDMHLTGVRRWAQQRADARRHDRSIGSDRP